MQQMKKIQDVGSVFVRPALGIAFLSALAGRFGLWGAFCQPNIAWGSFARFVAYTGKLNWFLPTALIPALAVMATGVEVVMGFSLVIGLHTCISVLLSGILLMLFGLAMASALGVKAPLNFSVSSAAGGAFLLAIGPEFPLSVDSLRQAR